MNLIYIYLGPESPQFSIKKVDTSPLSGCLPASSCLLVLVAEVDEDMWRRPHISRRWRRRQVLLGRWWRRGGILDRSSAKEKSPRTRWPLLRQVVDILFHRMVVVVGVVFWRDLDRCLVHTAPGKASAHGRGST
jgi:hypothetical protein